MTGNLLCLAMFVGMQAMDVFTTFVGLRSGGVEANPLASSLMAHYGEFAIYGVKAAVVVLALWTAWLIGSRTRMLWWALWIANLLYLPVLANNLSQLVHTPGG